jgi:cell division protease FtsH
MDPKTPPTKQPKNSPKKGIRFQAPQGPQKNRGLIWFGVTLIALAIVSSFYNPNSATITEKSISEIGTLVKDGRIKSVVVTNDTELVAETNDGTGTKYKATLRQSDPLKDYGITPDKTNLSFTTDNSTAIWVVLLQTLLPAIIVVGLILYLFKASSGQNGRAMNFGQAKVKLANLSKVRFKDVAGLAEAKQELMEEVEFLRNPTKFTQMGAEIPKGVLLVGPPGTGKTMLAKAVAGEAGVPFFTISASEFVEMFVGVGASRVRDLFAKAKKTSPCIIFIDELDAIGRQRGSGMGGGHDEREQTLNQILVEMDGFETDSNVIVMAATNRPDVLDQALLRPGRFDRQVVVDLPTRGERLEVLQVYAVKKPLASDVDLAAIAGQTAGMSPADLKNILNEAAILTARREEKKITQEILHIAAEKVLVGAERPSRVLSDHEKHVTAAHEAGHAIVGHVLPNTDDIHKVSIVSRGRALGLTWSLPKEDRHLVSKAKFKDELAMLLAGRMAEMITFNEGTTGASNDLKRATDIARRMVTEYGMSETLGLRAYGDHGSETFMGRSMAEPRNYAENTAEKIDAEVSQILYEAQLLAKKVLMDQKQALEHLTALLLEKETVSGPELDALLIKDTGVQKTA